MSRAEQSVSGWFSEGKCPSAKSAFTKDTFQCRDVLLISFWKN